MKTKNLLKTLVVLPFLFATNTQAQLVDCNVFLQGRYVEVGINWNGAFGSSVPAPAGYHPNLAGAVINLYNSTDCGGATASSSSLLGFVSDPDMDGWAVGTPAYFGDYFVPGTPQEGWSLMANGVEHDAWNLNDVASTDITVQGSNISYSDSAGVSKGIWQGSFDSIAVVQITTLDTNDLFFTVKVILTNLASTDRNNVYYLRTVDPDNEVTLTSDYTTQNVIDHQLPNIDNLTSVSARGITYGAYYAMSTNDLRAKAFIMDFGLSPAYPLDQIYNETTPYSYTEGDSSTTDVGIGLVFNIGTLTSVDSVGAVDSAMRTTSGTMPPNRAVLTYNGTFHPTSGVTHINNVNTANVKVYPNPAKNILNITGLSMSDQIKVFNMMGHEAEGSWPVIREGQNTFDISMLPAGQYLIQMLDKEGNIKSKTPVQKL